MGQFLQILVTLVVGAIAGAIAYRTARDRVVLDLFDRRVAAVERFNEIILPILQHANAEPKDFAFFDEASAKAKYLFGDDVAEFLDSTRKYITRLMEYNTRHKYARQGDQLPTAKSTSKRWAH